MQPVNEQSYDTIESPIGLPILHKGPPLIVGPLPAIFYFTLGAEDSLNVDPFNQLVLNLANDPIRIFSFTLPGHTDDVDKSKAITFWAEAISKNHDVINEFIFKSLKNINYLVEQGFIYPHRIATAGLSRGSFIATHLALREPRIHTILGFAPLTKFEPLEEFQPILHHPIIESLELNKYLKQLVGKNLRYYIGNRDTRVGTEHCFSFIKDLTDVSYDEGLRSPPVELIVSPAIGMKGHGTPPSAFQDAASWIKGKLLST